MASTALKKIGIRQCIVSNPEPTRGLFHAWSHYARVIDASPLMGGHPGGQISDTYGIVELADGSVIQVRPEKIKFLDSGELFMGHI